MLPASISPPLPALELTPDDVEALRIFQTDDDPLERLKDIACDLSHNVTGIHGREDFHIAFDLVAHSQIKLSGAERGWLQGFIITDSGCGKTQLVTKLCEYYELPEWVNMAMDTRGDHARFNLLAASQRYVHNRKIWFLRWGVLPMNDKRMVVLDGMQRTTPHTWANLRYIRGHNLGETRLAGHEVGNAASRTRALYLTTLFNRAPSRYPCSEKAIRAAFGKHRNKTYAMDVDLFDFIILADRDDVPASDIEKESRQKYNHQFTSELCRKLLLWAWTREKIIYRGFDCHEEGPKTLRMAAAIAARLFSTEDGEILIVKQVHVGAAKGLLRDWTSNPYIPVPVKNQPQVIMSQADKDDVMALLSSLTPSAIARLQRTKERFCRIGFSKLIGISVYEAQKLMKMLLSLGAVEKRSGRKNPYVLTPPFLMLLHEMEVNDARLQENTIPRSGTMEAGVENRGG